MINNNKIQVRRVSIEVLRGVRAGFCMGSSAYVNDIVQLVRLHVLTTVCSSFLQPHNVWTITTYCNRPHCLTTITLPYLSKIWNVVDCQLEICPLPTIVRLLPRIQALPHHDRPPDRSPSSTTVDCKRSSRELLEVHITVVGSEYPPFCAVGEEDDEQLRRTRVNPACHILSWLGWRWPCWKERHLLERQSLGSNRFCAYSDSLFGVHLAVKLECRAISECHICKRWALSPVYKPRLPGLPPLVERALELLQPANHPHRSVPRQTHHVIRRAGPDGRGDRGLPERLGWLDYELSVRNHEPDPDCKRLDQLCLPNRRNPGAAHKESRWPRSESSSLLFVPRSQPPLLTT